jgi:hypothetical protein
MYLLGKTNTRGKGAPINDNDATNAQLNNEDEELIKVEDSLNQTKAKMIERTKLMDDM